MSMHSRNEVMVGVNEEMKLRTIHLHTIIIDGVMKRVTRPKIINL